MSRIAAVAGAAIFGLAGAWAFLAPRSFYDTIATWPPYNGHFIHDLGAFQLGLAVALVAALLHKDALMTVLVGAATAGLVHFAAHLEDRSLGGRPTDPLTICAIAFLMAIGALLRWRELRRG